MSTHAFQNPFLPQNPFFAPAADAPVAADVAEESGEVSYALVQNGPAVAADEVECDVDAVEITVKWGTQVLCVKHLDVGGSFFVGEGTELALPEETLGAARAALVVSEAGSMTVIVPPGATATVNGALVQSSRIAIADKMSIVVEAGSVTFEIGSVRKGKVAPVGFLGSIANAATGFVGLSFLGHAAIVASLAMFMPKMGADDAEGADRDQILMMQKLLNASAERDLEQPKTEANGEDGQPGGQSTGEPHKGEQGVSGKTDKAITTSGRLAIKGDAKESQLSKKDEMALARDFGLIGLIRTGSQDAVTSPWGDTASGKDVKDAHGKMWASNIDDAFGYGFGLEGTGEGGGGDGTGVGLDHVHTVGNGGGNGPGVGLGKCADPTGKNCDGMGISSGKLPGNHVAKGPSFHEAPVFTDGGRLPPEAIQRVVRQNFGRFRLCYEQGLRTNPSLNGRVVTKFVISRDGSVSMAQDGGSDLPDAAVKQCIIRSFGNLSFPEPQGGAALVTYPLIMQPGES